MIVRKSTDFPVPDPPTTPRTSPRRTSRSRLSWMTCLPNCVRRPRMEMIDGACGSIRRTLDTHIGKQVGEECVEDDHQKQRLDHRLGGEPPDAFGAATDPHAFVASHQGD